jgi:hypothetical protein
MPQRRKHGAAGTSEPVTYETVRQIASALPGAVEGTSYGTPAFHVGKKLFVRKHQDGDWLVVKITLEERAMRMRAEPETYFITDHYLNDPWILVRLATVARDDLMDLLEEAWRLSAPPRLLLDAVRAKKKPNPSTPKRRKGDCES